MTLLRTAVCFLVLTASASCFAQGAVVGLEDPFPSLSFASAVDLQHADDGSTNFYVVEQDGRIRVFDVADASPTVTTFLDISGPVLSGGEQGLLGLAFHPDYATNGYFYVDYTVGAPLRTRISRFTRSLANPLQADPTSEEILLEVNQPFQNHNAGAIAFGPDGYLYVTLGDGGSGGDPQNHGQRPTTLLGSILRLDVDGGGGPLDCAAGTGSATIPAGNPIADGAGGDCDEIWAYGLRNPWRMSFDSETGDLWAGDVGQGDWEEIDLIEPGLNYGWRIMEGLHCYNPSSGCDMTGLTLPVWEYSSNGGNCSVTGGYVYRGEGIPELEGRYVYGDYCSGTIWALDTSVQPVMNELLTDIQSFSLTTFGTGPDGELYLASVGGRLRRFVRIPPVDNEGEQPATTGPVLTLVGPNPLGARTTLRFAADGPTRLAVYDLLGREVAVLYEGTPRAGAFAEARFSAEDLPSGLYLARLVSGGAVRTTTLTVAH